MKGHFSPRNFPSKDFIFLVLVTLELMLEQKITPILKAVLIQCLLSGDKHQ